MQLKYVLLLLMVMLAGCENSPTSGSDSQKDGNIVGIFKLTDRPSCVDGCPYLEKVTTLSFQEDGTFLKIDSLWEIHDAANRDTIYTYTVKGKYVHASDSVIMSEMTSVPQTDSAELTSKADALRSEDKVKWYKGPTAFCVQRLDAAAIVLKWSGSLHNALYSNDTSTRIDSVVWTGRRI